MSFSKEQGYREQELLFAARDHLISARQLFDSGLTGLDSAGYLGHLGFELLLKALLLHQTGQFPNEHRLTVLVDLVEQGDMGLDLPEPQLETLGRLSDFYHLRYPKPDGPISICSEDADELATLFNELTKNYPPELKAMLNQTYSFDEQGNLMKGDRYVMFKVKDGESPNENGDD